MCELLAVSSRRPTRLNFSLAALVARTTPGHSPRDGWGVAFYQGRDVALYREPAPASGSALVQLLETRGPPTTLAVSHVRHATLGAVNLANTQPFVRALAGRRHIFAHNGNLPGFAAVASHTPGGFDPVGDTDSEAAFCALLARLAPCWQSARPPTLQERLDVVADFAAILRPLGPANFLYADGELLFAHAHQRIQAGGRIAPPGLHLLQRRCRDPLEPLQVQGVCVACGYQEVTLLASVPLSDEAWQPLGDGEIVVVADGQLRARRANDAPTRSTTNR